MFFLGDFAQLPPVSSPALYSPVYTTKFNPQARLNGRMIINSFAFFELTKSFGQQGDSALQFRRLLDHIAYDSIDLDDFKLLLSRNIPIERNLEFRDAIRIYPSNEKVKQANNEFLRNFGKPIAVIEADNNPNIEINSDKDDDAKTCLHNKLYLSIGCKVLLRTNIAVQQGLCNGSEGIVQAIVYGPGKRPPELPEYVLVLFPRYSGDGFTGEKLFPIVPITKSWTNKHGITVNRKQIPLMLAYSITVHRAQGLTIDKAIVELSPNEWSHGLTYTTLSRVGQINDLLIEGVITMDRLASISTMPAHHNLNNLLHVLRTKQ